MSVSTHDSDPDAGPPAADRAARGGPPGAAPARRPGRARWGSGARDRPAEEGGGARVPGHTAVLQGPPRLALGPRLILLYTGLVLFGGSCGLMVRAGLGLGPWDVLHQGIADHTGISIGVVAIVVGALVMPLWWPLRQRPGLGTFSNIVLVGASMDGVLWLLPPDRSLLVRVPLLVGGVVLNGLASGLYISARFGPGPRDGLMTGLHLRTGRSLRLVRTSIEVTVLVAGALLGGSYGVGTLLYALAIGPLVQFFLRLCARLGPADARPLPAGAGALPAPAGAAAAAPGVPDGPDPLPRPASTG